MPTKKPPKAKTEKKFKPVPKAILPREDIIHFGNEQSGPICRAGGKGLRLALQGFSCTKCLDVWEEVMFDKLYGTNMEEDLTCP